MRWLPLVLLSGCVGEQKTPTESDADTDADADSDTDADTDADADTDPSILINFDATDCEGDASTVAPGPGESNMLAAAILGPGEWPYLVTTVHAALSNEPVGAATCDASQAHEMLIWVVSTGASGPPASQPPNYVLSFEADQPSPDPVRILTAPVNPPLVLAQNENIVVAVRFAGTYPNTSCLTACGADFLSGADFWSNAVDAPYDWQPLSDFNILSNLWIWADGAPAD